MKIAITANRKLDPDDNTTIFNKMAELVTNENVEAIYFGGAIGGDHVALEAALSIQAINKPKLIVVVPCVLANQPKVTHENIKKADELIELKNPITQDDNWKSFHQRNEYMVDHAEKTICFFNGLRRGGSYSCAQYAEKQGKVVEYIIIIGDD